VLANKLLPRVDATPRGGHELMAPENVANGDVRAAIPELEQLALNATVAPGRVLPSQTHDQLVELTRCRRGR